MGTGSTAHVCQQTSKHFMFLVAKQTVFITSMRSYLSTNSFCVEFATLIPKIIEPEKI